MGPKDKRTCPYRNSRQGLARAFSCLSCTAEARIRSHVRRSGVCGWQGDSGTGFGPSTWSYTCHYHSVSAPYSINHVSPLLCLLSSGQCQIGHLTRHVPWILFCPKRGELTGEWDEELNDLYSSPNIVRVIKSIVMRWSGHVAHMGERFIQGFGEETWGKDTTLKTQA
jgi:hypothetical protein